jgi:sugar phosphate isomerase/epimerase
MEINIYPTPDLIRDPARLIERCRRLGVRQVCCAVDALLDAGADGAGDDVRLPAFVGRLADAGIRLPVMMDSFGRDPGLVLDPAGHRGALDAKRRMLDALGRAGVGVLLNYLHLPLPIDPGDDARLWDGLATVYRAFVAHAEAAGVRVANHAIWRCLPDPPLRDDALARGVTMDGYREYRPAGWDGPYLLASHTDLIRLLEAAPSPANGVCFCTGMHIMGGDAPALIETFRGRIVYAQARDVRGRWPAAREVSLGAGELDFADILGRLAAAGYDGSVGPEHLGAPRFPGDDLEAAAVAFLRPILDRVQSARGAT